MANAWPPLEESRRGAWRYRWTSGVTRRANSALAIGEEAHVDELVALGEAFYAERDAPAMFLVSSASAPHGLSAHLAGRGYRAEARTLVMTATTAAVMGGTRVGSWDLTVADCADDDWFETYWSVESTRGRTSEDALVCRHVMLRPARAQLFVSARAGGSVAGTGQTVFEAGWGGVQCMATLPMYRGRGAASAILASLASGAAQAAVERLYLAVQADNRAVALYERAGFSAVHTYEYLARH